MTRGDFERIRAALAEVDPDEPLTASEILEILAESGEDFESPHRVATVLGRHADSEAIEVIRERPYRYRFLE